MKREHSLMALAIAGVALYLWRRHRASDDAASEGSDTDSPATGVEEGMPGSLSGTRYAPHASETIDLFTQAAAQAGLPTHWATDDALHSILAHESNGWVGIPNLQFGAAASPSHQDRWPAIWAAIRAGTWRDLLDSSKVGSAGPSSATGLGQLTASNIPKYYPSGLDGIGQPIEEAVGMLRYIEDRYTDPASAWAFWQVHHWY